MKSGASSHFNAIRYSSSPDFTFHRGSDIDGFTSTNLRIVRSNAKLFSRSANHIHRRRSMAGVAAGGAGAIGVPARRDRDATARKRPLGPRRRLP
jgi:hypothetical protein